MKAERLAGIRKRWLEMEMNDRDLAAFAERVIDPLFTHIDQLERLVPDADLLETIEGMVAFAKALLGAWCGERVEIDIAELHVLIAAIRKYREANDG